MTATEKMISLALSSQDGDMEKLMEAVVEWAGYNAAICPKKADGADPERERAANILWLTAMKLYKNWNMKRGGDLDKIRIFFESTYSPD